MKSDRKNQSGSSMIDSKGRNASFMFEDTMHRGEALVRCKDIHSGRSSSLTLRFPGYSPGGKRVTEVGWSSVIEKANIMKVVLPGGLRRIDDWAFLRCSMARVVIPETVKEIGMTAFKNCWKLEKIAIPTGTTIIETGTFSNCLNLHDVILQGGLEEIRDDAFCECSKLEEIILPNGLKTIGDGAFYQCVSLRRIVIPDTVVSIGNYAFEGCVRLERVVLPPDIQLIGADAFRRCGTIEIVGPSGSVAEDYCLRNGLLFREAQNE